MIETRLYGKSALIVEFEKESEESSFERLYFLKKAIEDVCEDEILALIPGLNDLTIVFDKEIAKPEEVNQKIVELESNLIIDIRTHRSLKIPVCYDQEFGLDLAQLSEEKNLSVEEIITLHHEPIYQLSMMGFIAGFPYLSGLNKQLLSRRLNTPRESVPSGSVGIANLQSGIYPKDCPGGWKIIGRTPVKSIREEEEIPFLFRLGDLVKFNLIDRAEFEAIKTKELVGDFDVKSLYVG
jgi:inhibitor of KinA